MGVLNLAAAASANFRAGGPSGLFAAAVHLVTSPRTTPRRGRPFEGKRPLLRFGTVDPFIYRQVLVDREYACSPTDAPGLIIDGGAHIGLTSLFFAQLFPSAQIIAVEPQKDNFALLSANTAGLENVLPLNAAICHRRGPVAILNSSARNWEFRTGPAGDDEPVTVPGVTIPDLMRRARADRVGILKLDIEGAEREVLNSSARWIDAVDTLLVELHDRTVPGCSRALFAATTDFTREWTVGEVMGLARA